MRRIFEDAFLVILILLNIFEFMQLLPPELDYIKKIVSWTLIGYLFYRLDLAKILFGKSSPELNILIVIAYILLAFKKFTASVAILSGNVIYLKFFFQLITGYAANIQEFTFIMGGTILFILSLYMAHNFTIGKHSLMGLIHETGKPPKKIRQTAARALTIFLVLSMFFLFLFDPVIEWLAIAIDSSLIMLLVVVYVFHIIRIHKRYDVDKALHKIGNFGENFYQKFIRLFYSKKDIFLGIAGILILHVIIDLGMFILPAIIPFFKPLYYGLLDPLKHQSLISLFMIDIKGANLFTTITIMLTYVFNIIGMTMLLITPTAVWHKFFKKQKLHVSDMNLALLFSGLTAFLISPVFRITMIMDSWLIGVDIQTMAPNNPVAATIAASLIFIVIYLFGKHIKNHLIRLALLVANITVAIYTYNFFISTFIYFITAIRFLALKSQYISAIYFSILLGLAIIFYVTGLISIAWISIEEVKN